MDPLTQGRHRDLSPRAAEDVDGGHGLDLLETLGQNHEHGGRGHGVIEHRAASNLTEIFIKNASLFPMRRAIFAAMPGVGKLLKQAQKMQRSIEALQAQLDTREIEVAAGGGAVKVKVSASGKFLALSLDPEFLKEDAKLVSDTVLAAIQDAAKQAKELNDSEMQKVTSAFQMPGIF